MGLHKLLLKKTFPIKIMSSLDFFFFFFSFELPIILMKTTIIIFY